MLEIDILDRALEFLDSLPTKHARQVLQKIDLLAVDPLIARSKQLKEFAPWRRYRSGNYRIIYFVSGDFLKVVLIDKRNDDAIYRQLKQMFR